NKFIILVLYSLLMFNITFNPDNLYNSTNSSNDRLSILLLLLNSLVKLLSFCFSNKDNLTFPSTDLLVIISLLHWIKVLLFIKLTPLITFIILFLISHDAFFLLIFLLLNLLVLDHTYQKIFFLIMH